MSKKQLDPVRQALPLIATLFVVVGIAAIVLTRPQGGSDQPAENQPPVEMGPVTATVFQDGDVIRVTQTQGTSSTARECTVPQGTTRAASVDKNGIVISLTSGQNVRIGFDCMAKEGTLPEGVLNPSGSRSARMSDPRSDGGGTVTISDGTNEETMTLRGPNARPFRDPLIIGWMDNQKIAVIAFQGDARHALMVESAGRVTQLKELPETATEFAARDGAFWYVTATPGPGIELGPRGPSEVRRVGMDGTEEVVSRNENDAIEAFMPGPDGRFAYVGGGALYVGKGTETKNVGTGRPLGWGEDGTALVVRNGQLVRIADDGAVVEVGIDIPDGVVSVWNLTLDEEGAER